MPGDSPGIFFALSSATSQVFHPFKALFYAAIIQLFSPGDILGQIHGRSQHKE